MRHHLTLATDDDDQIEGSAIMMMMRSMRSSSLTSCAYSDLAEPHHTRSPHSYVPIRTNEPTCLHLSRPVKYYTVVVDDNVECGVNVGSGLVGGKDQRLRGWLCNSWTVVLTHLHSE